VIKSRTARWHIVRKDKSEIHTEFSRKNWRRSFETLCVDGNVVLFSNKVNRYSPVHAFTFYRREVISKGLDWIQLAQDMEQLRVLVNKVMNFRVA
jgi:hypothetical protein